MLKPSGCLEATQARNQDAVGRAESPNALRWMPSSALCTYVCGLRAGQCRQCDVGCLGHQVKQLRQACLSVCARAAACATQLCKQKSTDCYCCQVVERSNQMRQHTAGKTADCSRKTSRPSNQPSTWAHGCWALSYSQAFKSHTDLSSTSASAVPCHGTAATA